MISVGRLDPGNQWDQNMLDLLFSNRLYPTGLQFKRCVGYPNDYGCVLIIPGRYWHEHTDQISEALATYEWVLALKTSDEEDVFDIAKVRHPNIHWWVQTPRADRDYGDARLFGVGFPAHFNNLAPDPPGKTTEVFLSAQNTHERRHQAFAALDAQRDRWCVEETDGFTKGMDPCSYALLMQTARIAPAPSGPVSPDSFRLYEALEAHAVPIADDVTPAYDSRGYWERVFPAVPFPVLTDYPSLPGYIKEALAQWPANANRLTAWWIRQKRAMTQWLRDDLDKLGAL
jgi:hypothetical protein